MEKALLVTEKTKISITDLIVNLCRRIKAICQGRIDKKLDLETFEKLVDDIIPAEMANLKLDDQAAIDEAIETQKIFPTVPMAIIKTAEAFGVDVTALTEAQDAIQAALNENTEVTQDTADLLADLEETIARIKRQMANAATDRDNTIAANQKKINKAAFLKRVSGL